MFYYINQSNICMEHLLLYCDPSIVLFNEHYKIDTVISSFYMWENWGIREFINLS